MENKLRAYRIANIPRRNNHHTIYRTVKNPEEAFDFINRWAERDLKNESVEFNAFGLEEFIEGQWQEWYNEEGQDIIDVMKEGE